MNNAMVVLEHFHSVLRKRACECASEGDMQGVERVIAVKEKYWELVRVVGNWQRETGKTLCINWWEEGDEE